MLKAWHTKGLREAGCDEAGRGCLAGPVVAAAVILPKGFKSSVLNDSKQLSEKTRSQLRKVIEQEAEEWAVSFVYPREIDEINILKASFKAMHHALDKIEHKPAHILVDGNRFIPYANIKHSCIIKGDGKYLSIAAASVLAKTHRDEYMEQIHQEYPQFGWDRNKGYPTVEHRRAIKENGACKYHRMSFTLLPNEQLSLGLF